MSYPCQKKLAAGEILDPTDIALVSDFLLDPAADDEDKALFLTALSHKGEHPDEIAAFVQIFLDHAITPPIDIANFSQPLIDVCGTGGDRLALFNISTATTFVLAAAGAAVVKHGNRGITSPSGGADVLEALGVPIDLPPAVLAESVERHGFGFLFAPAYHPAFKAVAGVRRALAGRGQRSIFNLIGPLLNPVRPPCQLIGVYDSRLPPTYASILVRLGRRRAWAVHGEAPDTDGMDEISLCGRTHVCSVEGEKISKFTIDPQELGLQLCKPEDLRGGDAHTNAKIITGILSGEMHGAPRDAVLLNTAAGLVICAIAADMYSALHLARETIDSGSAKAKLVELQGAGF